MIRCFTVCSATIRAMCSIILSYSRILTASEGASRCSYSIYCFRVAWVMFMSLQIQEASRPPYYCCTSGIRATFGWCLYPILRVFLIIWRCCKHPPESYTIPDQKNRDYPRERPFGNDNIILSFITIRCGFP